jgi:uncharacterized membrane protein (UPF0127 family)
MKANGLRILVLSPHVIAIVSLRPLSQRRRVKVLFAASWSGAKRREKCGYFMIKDESEQASTSKLHLLPPADVTMASRGLKDGMKTPTPIFCVYNQTRECFLGLRVAAADTTFTRLKGMIGRLHLRSDEGIWVVPSSGVHTLGVLFRLDLIYLDESQEVIEVIEYFPRFRIAPLRIRAASVLELPQHTIYSSQTQKGDRLLICTPQEMEGRLQAVATDHVNDGQQEPEVTAQSG